MSPRQESILKGILRDREHYAALEPRYGRDCKLGTERERIADARDGFVTSNPGSWLGLAMTPSLYVMVSRDYKTLERRGLIQRHALGYSETRTTHLSLTDAGDAAARELVGSERPPAPVGRSRGIGAGA